MSSTQTSNTQKTSSSTQTRNMLIVVMAAVMTRALLFYLRYRKMLRMDAFGGEGIRAFGGSDVPGWVGMARYIARNWDFSYWLMGVRPPLSAMSMAVVFELGGGKLMAVTLQAGFGVLTALVGYLLGRRLFSTIDGLSRSEFMAFVVGLLLAVDPASVSASVTLLAEPLFNLMITTVLLFLVIYVQDRRWYQLGLAALFLALAMFTRPTAIYFWVIVPLMLIPLMKRWWLPSLVLALVGMTVYLGWSANNYRHRGVFTYSLQPNFTLLFLRSVSAEHLATGAPVEDLYVEYAAEIYRRIGQPEESAQVDTDSFWDFHVARSKETYDTMGQFAREKLMQYWPYALLGTVASAWRMYAYTNLYPSWVSPIEIIYHIPVYGAFVVGTWQAYRRKEWALLMITGMPILYVTGLTFASQTSAMDTRMRTPIAAPIMILAVYGGAYLLTWWRNRKMGVSSSPTS